MRRAVLEFINERDGERIVHGRLLDADAYDAWTCTEQLKEAMSYQALAERREFDPVDVPRREKTLLLAALLLAAPDSTRLTELGSSDLEPLMASKRLRRCSTGWSRAMAGNCARYSIVSPSWGSKSRRL